MRSNVLIFAAGAVLSACASKPVTYVGLADSETSFVRTLHTKEIKKCPEIQTYQGAIPLRVQMNLEKFDTAYVCEASLPLGTTKVGRDDDAITVPTDLSRVVIMGDTGCRVKGDYLQKCDDEKEWPFSRIVHSVEKEDADLVIHVGDYHYRETCTDPVKCAPYKGLVGYGYKPWEADFFGPAAPLLRTKPFIFGRGNHEDCHRAHEGFSKTLTPLGEKACVEAQETRYTNIGNILVVNFDNGSLSDKALGPKDPELKELRVRYRKMIQAINSRPEQEVWLITHKPIWGLAPVWNGPPGTIPINVNMQLVVKEMPLPKKVKFVFGGHIHNFQIAQGDHPLQLVVGESGTALDYFNEETRKLIPSGFKVFPSDHGYLVMEKDGEGKWIGLIKSFDGKTDFTCQMEEDGVPCK
ncbi:MAG: metallophosphoesterase [Bdellovibrio sp.]